MTFPIDKRLTVICVVLERMEAIKPLVHDALLDKMPDDYFGPQIESALRLVLSDIKSWIENE
jgi:hypothetical protein